MPPTQPPQGGAKFFIGGLNRSTTDEALYNHFEPFGEITDCVVIKAANVSRGFGFVVFANKDELKENGFYTVTEHIIDDKRVEVKAAVPPSEAELQNQQKPKETETPCNRLFIGSLDSETTLETLTNYFSTYGTLVDALLPRDAEGKSRGFGFVAYSTTDAAETVLSRDHHIDGKQIHVKKALPRNTQQDESNPRGPDSSSDRKLKPAEVTPNPPSPQLRQWGPTPACIQISYLPPDITEAEIGKYLQKWDTVDNVTIIPHGQGEIHAKAVVSLATYEKACAVVRSAPHVISGHLVEVRLHPGADEPPMQPRGNERYPAPTVAPISPAPYPAQYPATPSYPPQEAPRAYSDYGECPPYGPPQNSYAQPSNYHTVPSHYQPQHPYGHQYQPHPHAHHHAPQPAPYHYAQPQPCYCAYCAPQPPPVHYHQAPVPHGEELVQQEQRLEQGAERYTHQPYGQPVPPVEQPVEKPVAADPLLEHKE